MAKAKSDFTKLTQRQRRHARDVEQSLKDQGTPPRQAEQRAWENAGEYPGGGKRRRKSDPSEHPKVNSSQRGINRKTRRTSPKGA